MNKATFIEYINGYYPNTHAKISYELYKLNILKENALANSMNSYDYDEMLYLSAIRTHSFIFACK